MARDFIIAISLANLCLVKSWFYVYYIFSKYNQYHSQCIPNMNYYFAALLIILLLATFFWAPMAIARGAKNKKIIRFAKIVFILILTIPLNVLISFSEVYNYNIFSKILIFVFIIILIIFLIRMYKFREALSCLPVKIVLILFPFFLYNFFQPVYIFLNIDSSKFADKPLAEAVTNNNRTSPRILWIIFDEMDQRLTFEDRPNNVKLPEIDRLKGQALFANNAYPPGAETDTSLPSLITGKIISQVKVESPNELLIKSNNENQLVGWSTVSNVFSKAYELGTNTALIGWYHPYGRIIGDNLTKFSWQAFEYHRQLSFSEAMVQQIKFLIRSIPFFNHCNFLTQLSDSGEVILKYRIESYNELKKESKDAVVNNNLGLILVHLPVPHLPGFFDSVKNDFITSGGGYMDNLVLADRYLGEIRGDMEMSGTWENTTVLVTSDHWLRIDSCDDKILGVNDDNAEVFKKGVDHRVPFMLKLAGQEKSTNYDQVFNTVLTHDLILALLNNELSSVDDVAKWIDSKRSKWEIPDYKKSEDNS